MKNENESLGASIGKTIHDLSYFLTMLFCALRACDVITWKWYWVMSPLFAHEIIGIIGLIVVGAITFIIVTDKNK